MRNLGADTTAGGRRSSPGVPMPLVARSDPRDVLPGARSQSAQIARVDVCPRRCVPASICESRVGANVGAEIARSGRRGLFLRRSGQRDDHVLKAAHAQLGAFGMCRIEVGAHEGDLLATGRLDRLHEILVEIAIV